ncbi:hypothetical protein [Candidatus Bathycorpusculum sp.]|uniref:hypothetical protein n=1 Tax=Candidatus Bathycorpusculum sp. TaxID=2994959 RepID=UPI00282F4E37|nr:hypothetical protein [Candidatus Termitimicrobium sp.]
MAVPNSVGVPVSYYEQRFPRKTVGRYTSNELSSVGNCWESAWIYLRDEGFDVRSWGYLASMTTAGNYSVVYRHPSQRVIRAPVPFDVVLRQFRQHVGGQFVAFINTGDYMPGLVAHVMAMVDGRVYGSRNACVFGNDDATKQAFGHWRNIPGDVVIESARDFNICVSGQLVRG